MSTVLVNEIQVETTSVCEDLDALFDEYLTMKEAIKAIEKKFKPIEKQVKELVNNTPFMETERFVIAGHDESREGYVVNPYTFWSFDIKRKGV